MQPLFSMKGEEFAINCCQQRRSAGLTYSKTIFGWGAAPDPTGRAYDALPDPESDKEGILPPPFASEPKGASLSF